MEPTKAPWATGKAPPLPPVSRGETTVAPWATKNGPVGVPQRPLEVSIPVATPRFPQPIPDPSSHAFSPAQKRITSIPTLRTFLASPTASDFLAFILALNSAVHGHALTEPCGETSPAVAALLKALETLDEWVTDIPPAAHTLRYGNPSFRVWFSRMKAGAAELVASLLPPPLRRPETLAELTPYFLDSFGNETRIDYGTGHETTFVALLFCLAKAGVAAPSDARALVTQVFARYLRLMRRIQTTYWLEPAGSHGVWGLDDYQFLPFLWGSAQLVDHPYLRPGDIHKDEVLEQYSADFLYLAAVRFVRHVKRGPLGETSPMLSDIAGVPSWSKVNKGMVKMYQAEVLGKVPIMQHFLFGSLLSFNPSN